MNKPILIVVIILITVTGCSGVKPDLGIENGELMPCPKTPNCVSSQAADEKHYIQPIHYTGAQQDAQHRLLQILASEKRAKIITAEQNYIQVEFTSALFRFVDDVEFHFPEVQVAQKVILVRSASRVGSSDFGVNRKRIEMIRNKFNESL